MDESEWPRCELSPDVPDRFKDVGGGVSLLWISQRSMDRDGCVLVPLLPLEIIEQYPTVP